MDDGASQDGVAATMSLGAAVASVLSSPGKGLRSGSRGDLSRKRSPPLGGGSAVEADGWYSVQGPGAGRKRGEESGSGGRVRGRKRADSGASLSGRGAGSRRNRFRSASYGGLDSVPKEGRQVRVFPPSREAFGLEARAGRGRGGSSWEVSGVVPALGVLLLLGWSECLVALGVCSDCLAVLFSLALDVLSGVLWASLRGRGGSRYCGP